MKTLLKFLRIWDGLWSIPSAFIFFLLVEYAGRYFFGAGFGAYDPSIFQAAVMAAAILVFANLIVQLALKFNLPAIWYMYHSAFLNVFLTLKPWQQIALTLFMYCFFFLVFILVFLKLA